MRKDPVHHDQQGIQFRGGHSPRMLKVVRFPNVRMFAINHKSALGALDRPVAQRPEPRVGLPNGCSQVGGEGRAVCAPVSRGAPTPILADAAG